MCILYSALKTKLKMTSCLKRHLRETTAYTEKVISVQYLTTCIPYSLPCCTGASTKKEKRKKKKKRREQRE